MNSDHLRFLPAGHITERTFVRPDNAQMLGALHNEYIKDGIIYCWMGDDAKKACLITLDEATLTPLNQTKIKGTSVDYVGEDELLFDCGDEGACLIDKKNLKVTTSKVQVPDVGIVKYCLPNGNLFIDGIRGFGVFAWPGLEAVWFYQRPAGFIYRALIVFEACLYFLYDEGVIAFHLSTGVVIWEIRSEDWASHPAFKDRTGVRILSERTGIVDGVLMVDCEGGVLLGLDISNGQIAWVSDQHGTSHISVTQEGIGWFILRNTIRRVAVATGRFLPDMPITVPDAICTARPNQIVMGISDMSTTHLIANTHINSKAGRENQVWGINRATGKVEWSVPIQGGMLTKLYLLNNRLYITGTMFDLDKNTLASRTMVVEGEGGYLCE